MGYPKLVRNAKTPVRVVIAAEEPNEFGERPVILDKTFFCNYQDTGTIKYTAEKQRAEVSGTILIDGDIMASLDIMTSDFLVSKEGVLMLVASTVDNAGTLAYTAPDEYESDAVVSGYVVIFGRRRQIVKGTKARNFDGTVNYTRLDVI